MAKKHKQPTSPMPEDGADLAHAPGKRHIRPTRTPVDVPRNEPAKRMHDQPWLPTSGLVGRSRRSARRG
jgi:hypothetical protein